MVLNVATALGTVVSLLLMITAGAYERQAKGVDAEVARDFKHWQRGAALFFAIGALPMLITRPMPELAGVIYDGVSSLTPLFVLLGSICFGASLSKLVPTLRRRRAQRHQEARRRMIAERGGPFPELSAAVVQSISQCLAGMEIQADARDEQGHHANLVVDSPSEGQRYIIYALPREHLFAAKKGGKASAPLNLNALARASAVAAAFNGRAILWAPRPPKGEANGYYAPVETEPRPYIVEGKDIHLAETVKKFDLVARSERRRREAREAARKAEEHDPRYHIPTRSDITPERAKTLFDRDSWERFNLLAPRHPHMTEVVTRRSRNLCDLCVQEIRPGVPSKLVVTDHEHACKHDGSVRVALDDSIEALPQTMPDCAQCHYDMPDSYESCLSRLALVHSGPCPPVDNPKEREASLDQQERIAALGRKSQ